MKLNSILSTLFASVLLIQTHSAYGQLSDVLALFEKRQPISTTFDDAIYEAEILGNFEPREDEYRPLDLQARTENGGYRLKSGLYTMNAKSFCLKGYTHGPSRGDGHLYAPLKGKKADFVQKIIQRYGQKPEIQQQNVQVLLWAIIAGADMKSLGVQYANTLNSLFSIDEILKYKGIGAVEEKMEEAKDKLAAKLSPDLKRFIEGKSKIKTMVQENRTFQEIEKVAILAGVAPVDMIREVSKGRWSYHPDGYFVRYFPNGYQQTKVDIYVPFQDAVQTDLKGKAIAINNDVKQPKEVVFDPSGMVASPANRPSQRIGISPIPVTPCGDKKYSADIAYWQNKAKEDLKNNFDAKSTIVNQSITCSYAKLYLENPTKFKWAGLSAIVSGVIGENLFKNIKIGDTYISLGLQENVLQGNRDVFLDLYWQHLAFSSKDGINQLRQFYCLGTISEDVYNAWENINSGDPDRIWQGNLDLLYHEQKDILQAMYNKDPNQWWIISQPCRTNQTKGACILNSPVPNDTQVFPHDDISVFEQRWQWIKEQIIPKWREFETNGENKDTLIKRLKEICPSCCNNN